MERLVNIQIQGRGSGCKLKEHVAAYTSQQNENDMKEWERKQQDWLIFRPEED